MDPEADIEVFFNPSCSKCRTVRGLLDERGLDAHYVRYLDQTPTAEQLMRVMELLEIQDPRDMMRVDEPQYEELGLDSAGKDELIAAMVAHPILIQRPIVIRGDRAVIARPPERALELLDPQ